MDVMRDAPDNYWDLAIVDPPYGLGEDGGKNRTHGVKQKNGKVLRCSDGGYQAKQWDRETPPLEYFDQLRRVTRHQIVWGINYYPIAWNGGRIIWDKVNDGADQSGAEIAFCSYNQRVDLVRYMWRGMMQGVSIKQGTTQQGNKTLNEKRIHPTPKPVKLYEWLLQTYAKPGDRILDTHMGSGSIAIACHYAEIHLTACEIDEDYYAAALARIEIQTRQLSLFDEKSLS